MLGSELRTAKMVRDGWRSPTEAAAYEYDSAMVPRFRVTYRDTLDSGLIVRTVEDMIWSEIRLYATWSGSTYVDVKVER